MASLYLNPLKTRSAAKSRRVSAFDLAGPTGLEPATSGVTGRRSNRLNYDPALGNLANLRWVRGIPEEGASYGLAEIHARAKSTRR